MCLAQGPQRSDAGEARTRGPSVSSQALNHWATALPIYIYQMKQFCMPGRWHALADPADDTLWQTRHWNALADSAKPAVGPSYITNLHDSGLWFL